MDVVKWCRQVSELGAGEILLTSMDRDVPGSASTSRCCRPCVPRCGSSDASGGVGTLQHFVEGAQGATGLLAASVFHFGTFTIARVNSVAGRGSAGVCYPGGGEGRMGKSAKKNVLPRAAKRIMPKKM